MNRKLLEGRRITLGNPVERWSVCFSNSKSSDLSSGGSKLQSKSSLRSMVDEVTSSVPVLPLLSFHRIRLTLCMVEE